MRTPELKKAIIKMAGTQDFYGYQIHQKLAEKNIKIGIGRLYAILGQMKSEGLLKDRWEKSAAGPKRRVYSIASSGKLEREKILMEAIHTVHEFYIEYLMSLPPKLSAFNLISSLITKGTRRDINIAYAAPRISTTIERLIRRLQEERPNASIYAVCPKTKPSDLEIEEIFVLDGAFNDIPMKDDYLDLLVVTGNFKKSLLDTCLLEWRRVLRPGGRVAILTPTALITKFRDPLEIGEFIEKREHPPPEGDEHLDSTMLKNELGTYFRTVREERVVHITLLTGTGEISS